MTFTGLARGNVQKGCFLNFGLRGFSEVRTRVHHFVLSDTAQADALALSAGVCHKGTVRRLRDFESIAAFFGDREIDEMQAAIDARREARAARAAASRDGGPTLAAAGPRVPGGGRRAG